MTGPIDNLNLSAPTELDTAYNRMLERLAPPVIEGYNVIRPGSLPKVLREANKLEGPLRQQEFKRIKRAVRVTKDHHKLVRKVANIAEREGRPDIAEEMREAQRRVFRGEGDPMESLKAGGTMLFKALDYPHKKLVRSWTTPERKGDKKDTDVGAVEWAKRIREEADKGSLLPRIIVGLADVPGWAFGGPLGAGVATAGYLLSDLPSGKKFDVDNFKQTVAETARDTGDFVLTAVTDPLNLITAGGGSSAKNAMSSTTRLLAPAVKANRLTKEAAQQAVKAVGEIAIKQAGTETAFPAVMKELRKVGVTSAEAKRVFGAKGEFLGKGQLRISLPFSDKASVELPQLIGKEYAPSKAAQAAYRKAIKEPIEKVTGSKLRELFDPTNQYAKQKQRGARAIAQQIEKRFLDSWEEISRIAPSRERREWIVRNVIDPYSPEGVSKISREGLIDDAGRLLPLEKMDAEAMPASLAEYWQQTQRKLADVAEQGLKGNEAAKAKKDILRAANANLDPRMTFEKNTSLLRGLSEKEARWVEEIDKFFKEVHDTAAASGYIGQNRIAFNAWTGRYFPRQYKRDYGVLDEVPEALRQPDPTALRSRRGQGVEIGKTAADVQLEIPGLLDEAAKKAGAELNLLTTQKRKFEELFERVGKEGSEQRTRARLSEKNNLAKDKDIFDDVFDQEIALLREKNDALPVNQRIDVNRIIREKERYDDLLLQRQRVTAEADPFAAAPSYVQKISRGIGAKTLEDSFVRAFGVPKTSDYATGAFGDYVGDYVLKGLREGEQQTYMLPRNIDSLMRGTFDSTHQTFRNLLARVPGAKSPAARAILKGFDSYARLTNFWKRNVLVTRPGYHALNGFNDTLQMFTDGMVNPAKWINQARQVFNGKGEIVFKLDGKEVRYSADEIKKLAEQYNLPISDISATGRLEYVGPAAANKRRFIDARNAEQKALRKKYKQETKGMSRKEARDYIAQKEGQTPLSKKDVKEEALDRYVFGTFDKSKDYIGMPGLPAKAGEWVAKQWEGHSKLAHFMWRLSSGDSPAVAAQRTFDVLLDYQNPSKMVQVARWIFPFATWMVTAPKMTARLAMQRPGSVAAVNRFFEAQQGTGAEPGSYIRERSPYYYLDEPGKKALGGARELIRRGIAPFTGETEEDIAGTGVGPGMSAVFMPREPFGESLTLPLEVFGLSSLLQGRGFKPKPELAVSSFAPLPKALGEYTFQKEALTGKPLQRSGPLELFPSRMPGVPAFFRSRPSEVIDGRRAEETPLLTRYVLPMAMSPAGIQLANMAAYQMGGGQAGGAPLSTIGRIREYAPPGQVGNIYSQQILNMLTGIPAYTVSPVDAFYDQSRQLRQINEQLRRAVLEAKGMQRLR
jgi:hypothetical protein